LPGHPPALQPSESLPGTAVEGSRLTKTSTHHKDRPARHSHRVSGPLTARGF
jgi:hypothetical protein